MFKSIALAVSFAAVALTATQSAAQEYPEVTLRMAHPLPETWPAVQWDKWWAEEVTARSGGKVKIELFWSGQLGGLLEVKNLVSSGAVDLGVFAQAVHASEMPMTSVAAGLLNRVSADAATAQKLAGEVYASAPTQAELSSLNLHPIKWTVASPYRLTCNKAIEKMADLEGLRVRAVGGAFVPIWMETYGMVPTQVQAPEIREGLQRGTLDCNFGPIEWVPFFSLQSVAPFISDINTGSFTTFQLFAPADTWAAWPESVRTLMTEVAQEAMQKELEWLVVAEAESMASFEEAGGKMIPLADMDAFVAKSPDMIAIWEAKMAEEGKAEAIAPIAAGRGRKL
jgi:TRAP-type C4-dicarboxylate transport system substrate-binding protein